MAQNNFPIFNGIQLAGNAWIENLQLESFTVDPTSVQPGRVWINTVERQVKYSTVDALGAVVIYPIAIPQDFADAMYSF